MSRMSTPAGGEEGKGARFVGVDASIFIFRAYFSRPITTLSPRGYPLNAVEGFTHSLLSLLDTVTPCGLLVAFDESLGQGFREALFPAYKSRRALPDEALAFQLAACRRMAEALGIQCASHTHYEADDLLATAARGARQDGHPVTIVSADKDLAQILEADGDQLWDHAKSRVPLSRSQWEAKYGVRCNRLADYLAVCGDSVDDIPGLPGIGDKIAKNIFNEYSSLEDIYDNLDELIRLPVRGAARLSGLFCAHRENVFLYRQLTRLCDTVPAISADRQAPYRGGDSDQFAAVARELGFSPGWSAGLVQRYPGAFRQ